MGLLDFLKKKSISAVHGDRQEPATQKLTFNEKEQIMVQRVTTEDMVQFTMIPYDLNCPVHKFVGYHSHPFAYMDLNNTNQIMAKEELAKINEYIIQAREYIKFLPKDIFIKVEEVAFHEYDPRCGYTRLMCTPYTFTGKVSKFPLSLSFMTRLDSQVYTAHGELHYGKDGNVLKADVCIWKNPGNSRKAVGWFFNFKTVGRTFLLNQVKSTIRPDKDGLPGVVYQFEDK